MNNCEGDETDGIPCTIGRKKKPIKKQNRKKYFMMKGDKIIVMGIIVFQFCGIFTLCHSFQSHSPRTSSAPSLYRSATSSDRRKKGKVLEFFPDNRRYAQQNLVSASSTSALTALSPEVAATVAEATTNAFTSSSSLFLSLSPAISKILYPIGSFSVLASIILIHECGHYFAARSYNISVDEFSIGFGPKVVGFTAFGNEFNLRALPLGGYVKFPENYNTTLAMEQERDLIDQQRANREKARNENNDQNNNIDSGDGKKNNDNGIGFQIANAISFGALAKKQQEEEEELQQEAARLKKKEEQKKSFLPSWLQGNKEEKTVTPLAETSENDNFGNVDSASVLQIEYYDDPNLLQNRPWFQRAVVLSGGVVFNFLTALFLYISVICSASGLRSPVFDNGAVVTQSPTGSSPSIGLLERGDLIMRVNGRSLSAEELSGKIKPSAAQESIAEFINTIRDTPDGESITLSVAKQAKMQPKIQKIEDVVIRPIRMLDNGPKTIGIMIGPNLSRFDTIQASNPANAIGPASKKLVDTTADTAKGLLKIFSDLLFGGSKEKGNGGGSSSKSASSNVSGPIGLLRTGTDIISTTDLNVILLFAAVISINLGVVNALPIPALDGGQLLFVIFEGLTGRKVDQRIQEEITSFAVLFLLLASVGTTIGDIRNLFSSNPF